MDLFSFTLRWELKLYTPLPDTNMNSYFIIPTTLSLDYGVNHKVKLACAFYCKGPHGKDSWSREAWVVGWRWSKQVQPFPPQSGSSDFPRSGKLDHLRLEPRN